MALNVDKFKSKTYLHNEENWVISEVIIGKELVQELHDNANSSTIGNRNTVHVKSIIGLKKLKQKHKTDSEHTKKLQLNNIKW